MAVFKPKIKETTEDRLQKAINLGRRKGLQEVLYWLEDATIDDADGCAHPIVSFISFDCKEEMLQVFKEQFSLS